MGLSMRFWDRGDVRGSAILGAMKKLFYVLGCLLILSSSPVLAIAEDPAIVVVRVYEGSYLEITIARGTETPEYLKFDAGYSKKAMAATARGYQDVVSKLYAQGYVLQQSIEGPRNMNSSSSTLIFVKSPRP